MFPVSSGPLFPGGATVYVLARAGRAVQRASARRERVLFMECVLGEVAAWTIGRAFQAAEKELKRWRSPEGEEAQAQSFGSGLVGGSVRRLLLFPRLRFLRGGDQIEGVAPHAGALGVFFGKAGAVAEALFVEGVGLHQVGLAD